MAKTESLMHFRRCCSFFLSIVSTFSSAYNYFLFSPLVLQRERERGFLCCVRQNNQRCTVFLGRLLYQPKKNGATTTEATILLLPFKKRKACIQPLPFAKMLMKALNCTHHYYSHKVSLKLDDDCISFHLLGLHRFSSFQSSKAGVYYVYQAGCCWQ